MAKPKTEKNPKGAGAPKKAATKVVSERVLLDYVEPVKLAIKKEIQRLISRN